MRSAVLSTSEIQTGRKIINACTTTDYNDIGVQ